MVDDFGNAIAVQPFLVRDWTHLPFTCQESPWAHESYPKEPA
jgi:hypothetical protein